MKHKYKDHVLNIKVSKDEKDLIKKGADEANMPSMSSFILWLVKEFMNKLER